MRHASISASVTAQDACRARQSQKRPAHRGHGFAIDNRMVERGGIVFEMRPLSLRRNVANSSTLRAWLSGWIAIERPKDKRVAVRRSQHEGNYRIT
jgi:hypothetical protein